MNVLQSDSAEDAQTAKVSFLPSQCCENAGVNDSDLQDVMCRTSKAVCRSGTACCLPSLELLPLHGLSTVQTLRTPFFPAHLPYLGPRMPVALLSPDEGNPTGCSLRIPGALGFLGFGALSCSLSWSSGFFFSLSLSSLPSPRMSST